MHVGICVSMTMRCAMYLFLLFKAWIIPYNTIVREWLENQDPMISMYEFHVSMWDDCEGK